MEVKQLEAERAERMMIVLNETQVKLIKNEETLAIEFLNRLTNNFEALVLLFDNLIFAEDYLELGEEAGFIRKDYNYLLKLREMEKGGANLSKTRTFKKIYVGLPKDKLTLNLVSRFENKVDKMEEDKEKLEKIKESLRKENLTKEVKGLNLENNKKSFNQRNEIFERYVNKFESNLAKFFREIDQKRRIEVNYRLYWKETMKDLTKNDI